MRAHRRHRGTGRQRVQAMSAGATAGEPAVTGGGDTRNGGHMNSARTAPAPGAARAAARTGMTRARPKVALAVAAALYGAAALQGRPAAAAIAAGPSGSGVLQEVIVTATKIPENVQDIPEAIEVMSGRDLTDLDLTRFQSLAAHLPSVSMVSLGPTEQTFNMRGVSDGASANAADTSTTGYFLDDASTSYYDTIPDLHLYDIQRVEVLDGPQGTLFGASAMAGVVRIITNKPDLRRFSAGVSLNGSQIQSGGQNSSVEGYLNLPLVKGETAVRLAAFLVHRGGFIDNVLQTRHWLNGVVSNNAAWAHNNYNTEREYGGRVSIAQKFGASWNAVLTVNFQNQQTDGLWSQDPGLPPHQLRKEAIFGPNHISDTFTDYDLHVEGDVGIGDLVYSSTFWTYPYHYTSEYSNYVQYNPFPDSYQNSPALLQSLTCLTGPTIQGGTDPYSGCQAPIMYYNDNIWTRQWSNELRLQSKPGGRWHWLVGLYWQKIRQQYDQWYYLPGIQPSGEAYQSALSYYSYYYTGTAAPLPHEWYSSVSRNDNLNTAEYGHLSFDVTKRLRIEGGLRWFNGSYSESDQWAGYFWAPKTPSPLFGVSAHKLTGMASISYKVTPQVMVYGTFSQGYRMGGVNGGFSTSCYQNGVPKIFTPDTLNNFEVGWKSTLLQGRMRWNGAVYYMPWSNFQAPIFDASICSAGTFFANFGSARIVGAESNIAYRVTTGLTLRASADYNDSRLTSIKPDFTGALAQMIKPDERLPMVPFFAYSASLRYVRPLSGALSGFFQYDIAYKGSMWSDLRAFPNPALGSRGTARSLQPAYSISDIRLGVENSRWTLEAYVTNLTNKNAILLVNTANYDTRQTTNEPRTFGLRVSYKWH